MLLYVNDLLPALTITLQDTNAAAVNLTGLNSGNFSLIFNNRSTGNDSTGAGTFTVSDAANGIVSYAWAAGDTANAGQFDVFVRAVFTAKPRTFYGGYLEVKAT